MRISAKTWLPLLGAGLAALGLAGSARAVDADRLTPSDAEVVVSVNVRQILDSELFKKYGKDEADKGLKDEKARKVLDAIGLNPFKDVDSLLFTSAGTEKPKMLFVARGKFDVDKIKAAGEKYAKDKPDDLKITTTDDLTIYEGKGDGKQPFFAHFVSDGKTLLASSDRSYLLQAVKTPPAGPSSDMRNALSKVDGKDSVWMAAVITNEMKKQMSSNPQGKELAPKLEAVTGTIDVASDVLTNLVIHTTDAKAAADVKKILNQVKPLLTLMAQSNEDAAPVLGELVDNLKITTDQNSVKISLKVTEDLIEKAAATKKDSSKDK